MADFGLKKYSLLYTTDAAPAIEEVKSLGGHLCIHIDPDLLVVELPPGTTAAGLKASTSKLPEKLSPATRAHVDSWNRVVERFSGGKVPVRPEKIPPLPREPCGAGGAHVKGHITHVNEDEDAVPPLPNNDTMTGDIKVQLFIISCQTGPKLNSSSELTTIHDGLMGAISFLHWAPPEGYRPSFTTYETPLMIPGDVYANDIKLNHSPAAVFCQNKLFCYYQNLSQQLCYTNISKGSNDWSSEIPVDSCFLSESPSAAALGQDIFVVYQEKNAGGALYYSVYTTDGNKWKHRNKPVNNSPMSWSPCAVVYQNAIYVFYADKYGDHKVKYSVYFPSNDSWSGEDYVVTVKSGNERVYSLSQSRPAAVVLWGKLRLYHMGWENNYAYCDVFDGHTWDVATERLPGVWLTSGPAAISPTPSQVYTYHQAAENDPELYQNLYVPSQHWTAGETEVPGSNVSYCPSVANWFDARGTPTMCVLMRDYYTGKLKYRQFYTTYGTTTVQSLQESFFRDPALAMVGCQPGSLGVSDYATKLCNTAPTNTKAYVIMISRFPLPEGGRGYKSITSPGVYTTWDNGNWGPSELDRVFAHESCHVFGALDEYEGSCNCSQTGGKNKIRNGNCEGCKGGGQECIMYHDEWKMCKFTQGQLGYPFQG